MPITEATVKAAKFFPELLPDGQFNAAIPATSESTPLVLDLRRITGMLINLHDVAVFAIAPATEVDIDIRIKDDDYTLYTTCGEFFPSVSMASPFETNFDMLAKSRLYLNLYNNSAGVIGAATNYNLWVRKPTVADKLKLGMLLTPEEKLLNEKYAIQEPVEKGILPLPISELIHREYEGQLLTKETHGMHFANISAAPTIVETVRPRTPNEFVVLTDFSITPGVAVNNIRLTVDRDNDAAYIDALQTYSLATTMGMRCFIPAMTELTLYLTAVAPGLAADIRFTIWRVKLTNLLRYRFGLLAKDELPVPEVADKVLAGIL